MFMDKVNAFEAKTRLSELLRETERGKTFVIFRRGKEVARLMPPVRNSQDQGLKQILEGFREIRKKNSKPVSIKELIEEGRRF